MLIRTPQLQSDGLNLVSKSSGEDFFCLRSLKHEINVPKATTYWGEVNNQQWLDESGIRVKVRLDPISSGAEWKKKTNFFPLHDACRRFLKRLGCIPGRPAKIIYFRLVYEE